MIVIFLLIPLSIVLASGFLWAFVWAARSGQYEDAETPSLRMLWDDAKPSVRNPVLPEAGAPEAKQEPVNAKNRVAEKAGRAFLIKHEK